MATNSLRGRAWLDGLGGVLAVSALLLIAVPTAVLGVGFIEEMEPGDDKCRTRCPWCSGEAGLGRGGYEL